MKIRLSYRLRLFLNFLLIILLMLGITFLFQRTFIEVQWTNFWQDYSLGRLGPELSAIISRGIPQARTWLELRGIVDELSSFYQAKIFLTDASGELRLQSRYPENISLNQDEVDKVLWEGVSSSIVAEVNGKRMRVVSSPLNVQGRTVGTVQIVLEEASVPNPLSFPLSGSLILGAGIATLLALLMAYYTSRRVTVPISEMRNVAHRYAQGDFAPRLKISSKDELGQLAETLNSMAAKLEEAEKNRKELLANLSHELRTPLTTVRGYIEALEDGILPEDRARESLKMILDELARTERLVNAILELSRWEAGAIQLELSTFSLTGLCEDICQKMALAFQKKGVYLEANLAKDTPDVKADRDRIREVIEILLYNALNYSPSGSWVRLSVEKVESGVRLSVTDNGWGIPAEELPYIFERFYRSQRVYKKGEVGTGLGLSIGREILEAHGLKFTVESQGGKGSSFSFILRTADGV